jgi:ATP-dependent protease Clp ATPase subunit
MSRRSSFAFRHLQSIGFGATLPQPKRESETEDEVAEIVESGGIMQPKKDRLKGLSTADLVEYGFIPEYVHTFST